MRINRVREILGSIEGLSESQEDKQKRLEQLSRNIAVKTRSLELFKRLVGEKIDLGGLDQQGEHTQQAQNDTEAQQEDTLMEDVAVKAEPSS